MLNSRCYQAATQYLGDHSMKAFRRPVTAAAVALGLTAALVATPAIAADYYYVDSDLGTEDTASDRGYPDGIWFTGGSTTGTQTSTDDGLVVTERTMLLYGAAELEIESGAHFVELVQSIDVDADGMWSLQLPVYMDNEAPDFFTTFRPAANNTTPGALDSEWILSWALPGLPAGTPVTLQDISDEIDVALEDVSPALLAFGILADSGETTVRSITFNGDTHFFTAEPEEEEEPPVEEDDEDLVDDEVEDAPPATPVEGEATFTG